MSFIIGIDSGGTHIVAQVISLTGKVKASYGTGPGNILIDYDGTKSHLIELISEINDEYSLKTCVGIIIGIAGLNTVGGSSEIQSNLVDEFKIPVVLMSDATLGIWNVLSGHEGILALAGTGSAVFSRFNNNIDRIGGWGYLIGDEGSAYDIVHRTLQWITVNYDKREQSEFTNRYIEDSGANSLNQLISKIYVSNRKEIANLAIITSNLIDSYPEAKQIISDAAKSLADQTILMMNRYSTQSHLIIGESGSVLQKNEFYREQFEKRILKFNINTKFIKTSRNNASGAFYWYEQHKEELSL